MEENKWAVMIARPNPRVINLWSDEAEARAYAQEINERYSTTEYYVIPWDGVKPVEDFSYPPTI